MFEKLGFGSIAIDTSAKRSKQGANGQMVGACALLVLMNFE